MDWIKVLNRHTIFEYNDLSDSEFRAWIRIMSVTAFMEAIPTQEQMIHYVHHKTLTSLQDKLKKHSTTLQDVLKKVLRDAQEVLNRREYWKIKQREKRVLNKNVNEDVNKTSTLIEENRTEENRREEIKEEGEESPPFPSTEIKKPKKKTIPPSINDVKAYCQERKNNVDPETWINHYKSNGWMVGKNKMKDWKAAVITWEKRGGNGNGSKGIGTYRTDIRGHQILDEAEQINRDYLAAKAARAALQTADDKARGAADNDDAPDFPNLKSP